MRPSFPTLLACLLLAMMSPAHARAAGAAAASTTTPAEAVALRDAEALGQDLFRLDRAAWFASDALVAAARGRVDPRVQGWITEERDDGIDVIYVDAVPAALYRVSIDAQGQPRTVTLPYIFGRDDKEHAARSGNVTRYFINDVALDVAGIGGRTRANLERGHVAFVVPR